MSHNRSCSGPSEPQAPQIPVNSAKHRPIFSAESFPDWFARTGKSERCTFCKCCCVAGCPGKPPSLTCPVCSVCQRVLLAGFPLLQYRSAGQSVLVRNIQNHWPFFRYILLHLLGKFAQNPMLPGLFGDSQMCISTWCSGDRGLCKSARVLREHLVNNLLVQRSAGLQESLLLAECLLSAHAVLHLTASQTQQKHKWPKVVRIFVSGFFQSPAAEFS